MLAIAHEAVSLSSLILLLHRVYPAAAAQRRAWADLDLPAQPVASRRIQLPTSADMLGLRRRGDRAFRSLGRRMDDARALAALPTLGDFRNRQRAADKTIRCTLVFAVAVRALAGR